MPSSAVGSMHIRWQQQLSHSRTVEKKKRTEYAHLKRKIIFYWATNDALWALANAEGNELFQETSNYPFDLLVQDKILLKWAALIKSNIGFEIFKIKFRKENILLLTSQLDNTQEDKSRAL